MSNVERARQAFDALGRGDFDAVAELLDPDVRWHGGDPDAEGACRDRGEALAFLRRAIERGVRPDVRDFVAAGDKVVVIHAGGANVTTFRDGKVVEMVHYPDAQAALAAARD